MRQAYIGLGSNLPWGGLAPEGIVAVAAHRLAARVGPLSAVSSLYRTQPVGWADQPAFLNAVVQLSTGLGPEALLDLLLEEEAAFGRERRLQNGPRTLDLDLLLLDDLVLGTDRVTVPHPRLAERRFVLEPLAEIGFALKHPTLGATMGELLRALPATGVHGPGAVERVGPLPTFHVEHGG